jgi:thymidylate kinase
MTETEALKECRSAFLEIIAEASNEIKRIDARLATLASIELEADLIQAETR